MALPILRFRNPQRIHRLVLKYRWFWMLLIAVLAVAAEILGHWPIDFQNLSPDIVRETILFVIFLPLSWGFLLSLVYYTEDERVKALEDLDRQGTLGKQLTSASHWDEMLVSIVQFPRTVVPVISTALHIYNPDYQRYELAAQWSLDGKSHTNFTPILNGDICQACKLAKITSVAVFMPCNHLNDTLLARQSTQYCIPLVHAERPVALLHLNFPTEITISSNQMRVLNSVAHEMALAIEGGRLQQSVILQAEATEAERKRIAQNLHDTLGQNISYLRLKLDQLTGEDALLEISQVKQELERMRGIAEASYQQVRGTLADLNPGAIPDLMTALCQYGQSVADRAGLKLQFENIGDPMTLTPHVRRQALFVSREALNNIEKHAEAHVVKICLKWEPQMLSIHIRDDGQGFDMAPGPDQGHYGLVIMQERAEDIQGSLTIQSAPGQGTEVCLRLPVIPLAKAIIAPT